MLCRKRCLKKAGWREEKEEIRGADLFLLDVTLSGSRCSLQLGLKQGVVQEASLV